MGLQPVLEPHDKVLYFHIPQRYYFYLPEIILYPTEILIYLSEIILYPTEIFFLSLRDIFIFHRDITPVLLKIKINQGTVELDGENVEEIERSKDPYAEIRRLINLRE